MAEIRWRFGHLLSLGVLVGCISSAAAAPKALSAEDASTVNELQTGLARAFFLSRDLKLDPALRAAANGISAAHLARIKQLVPVWLEEERRLQATATEKAGSGPVFYAVWARLLNELAFWQIEPGDAQYEKATLEAIKATPIVCATEGDPRFHDFSSRMLRVQAMPAAQQQAALATERQLLERWGKPRATPRPWPNPLPQDAAMAAIKQIQAGGPRPALAMAPHLASTFLAKRESYDNQAWETKCALQQWWLRVSLAQGSTPAAALTAFRYGTLLTAVERFGRNFESETEEESNTQALAKPAYPKMANYFDVTGATVISRRFDAAGKPVQASVTDRQIKVRGIRGTRPIAFENTFDALSLDYALKSGSPVRPGNTEPQDFKMVWQLESDEPDAAKPAKTSQGANR